MKIQKKNFFLGGGGWGLGSRGVGGGQGGWEQRSEACLKIQKKKKFGGGGGGFVLGGVRVDVNGEVKLLVRMVRCNKCSI